MVLSTKAPFLFSVHVSPHWADEATLCQPLDPPLQLVAAGAAEDIAVAMCIAIVRVLVGLVPIALQVPRLWCLG